MLKLLRVERFGGEVEIVRWTVEKTICINSRKKQLEEAELLRNTGWQRQEYI